MRKNKMFLLYKLSSALFIAVFLFGVQTTSWAASEDISLKGSADPILEALIAQAEAHNPVLGAAHERVSRATDAIREAGAKMGPTIGVAAGALWNKSDPMLPVISPAMGQIGYVPLGFRNTYMAGVGFMQTIYAGGSLSASHEAAKLARDAAQAEELRVYQNVCSGVRTAYFNRRRAEAKEVVAKEALTLAQNHQKQAEQLFHSGVVAKSDVLRSRVAVADSELDLIRAQNAVALSLTAIERAVGAKVDATTLESGAAHPANTIATPQGGLQRAYEQRPELRMYALLSKQAEKVARASQGQQLPQIMLGGALSSMDDQFFPSGSEEWRVGMVMYWNIFDSGEIAARTRQAKAQAREFLYNLDDMRNSIKMDVTQAELNLRSAQSRLNVAERQVVESEEDYRIAVKRYNAQVGTNLEMLDVRVALTGSRTELVDAIYDIEIAKSDLIFAIGTDMPMKDETRE